MSLNGRALVVAMCIGQLGNLLPHVVVPAVMTRHLIPAWDLSARQAGFMASAFALGYMCAVPFLTTLTDRKDARLILLTGSAVSGLATLAFGLLADGLWSAIVIWGLAGIGFAGAYMPGLKALVDRMPRQLAQHHLLYGDILDRRRPLVPDRPGCRRRAGLALGLLHHGAGSAGDDRGMSWHGVRQAGAVVTPPA